MRTTAQYFQRHSLLWASILLLVASCWSADDQSLSDISKRLDDSAKVLDEVMTAQEHGVPVGVIKRAQCVAVFPSMVEVAALVGAKHGKGFMSCRTSSGWSAPAPLDVTGGNWGAQFGGEKVDLVVAVMNGKAAQQMESGKFDFGVETSATAGKEGTHQWTMNSDVITYARSRGLFAGINLDGSSITQDAADTRSLYGTSLSLSDILGGTTKDPSVGQTFVSKVTAYAGKTRAHD